MAATESPPASKEASVIAPGITFSRLATDPAGAVGQTRFSGIRTH